MKNIYQELFEILKKGDEAILVTKCGPSLAKAEKTLFSGPIPEWTDKEGDEDSLYVEKNGELTTIVEHLLPNPRMILFGGGHISLALSKMASMLRFDVIVFDDRPSFANTTRFPWAHEVICDSFDNIAERISIRQGDYVIVLTRGHKHDEDCLRVILNGRTPFYMGMIGSRRRVAIVRRELAEGGCSQELLGRLHAPIGLSLGAVTPEEISISILAEIVQEKRACDGKGQTAERYADMELMEWLADKPDGFGEPSEGRTEKAALVTVLSTAGSTPREAGAKMAVLFDGRTIGTIGGGCAEAEVIKDALRVTTDGGWSFKAIDMTDSAEEDGMVCGGSMEVLIEQIERSI
jgi:xanthine dehydrogenase accessory factor